MKHKTATDYFKDEYYRQQDEVSAQRQHDILGMARKLAIAKDKAHLLANKVHKHKQLYGKDDEDNLADPFEDTDMFNAETQRLGNLIFFKYVDIRAYNLYHQFRVWIGQREFIMA